MCQQVFLTYSCAHSGTLGEFTECEGLREDRCRGQVVIEEPSDAVCEACHLENERLRELNSDDYEGLKRDDREDYGDYGDDDEWEMLRDNENRLSLDQEESVEGDCDRHEWMKRRVEEDLCGGDGQEDNNMGRLWELWEIERGWDDRE
ncbi:hypothetical protein MMC13_005725 [Lambiella insularis]|nr:hypothetical protein [Lambiella insularis]